MEVIRKLLTSNKDEIDMDFFDMRVPDMVDKIIKSPAFSIDRTVFKLGKSFREVCEAMNTDKKDPRGMIPDAEYLSIAQELASGVPQSLADALIVFERINPLQDDIEWHDSDVPIKMPDTGMIFGRIKERDREVPLTPDEIPPVVKKEKEKLKAIIIEQTEFTLELASKLKGLQNQVYELLDLPQSPDTTLAIVGLDNDGADYTSPIISSMQSYSNDTGGTQRNNLTKADINLTRIRKNKWMATITPPYLITRAEDMGASYKGDRPVITYDYPDRDTANDSLAEITRRLRTHSLAHYQATLELLVESLSKLETQEERWEQVRVATQGHNSTFSILSSLCQQSYQESMLQSDSRGFQYRVRALNIYDTWSAIASWVPLAQDLDGKATITDDLSPQEMKRLKQLYTEDAITEAFELFHWIHNTYLLGIKTDMITTPRPVHETVRGSDETWGHIPYTGTINKGDTYTRIDGDSFFFEVMGVHTATLQLQSEIMEAQAMASGADDKIWFLVTGSAGSIKPAMSKLVGNGHYIVQSRNKSEFYWLIQNAESSFVNGFIGDKNLHHKRLGPDTVVTIAHEQARCTKYFIPEVLKAHEAQCSSCKTSKQNEESARKAQIAKQEKEYDEQVATIKRKVTSRLLLTPEEQEIANEEGISNQSDKYAMSANPSTKRNSQASDGQPRSSYPANPKVNHKGTRITTQEIQRSQTTDATMKQESITEEVTRYETKMENGAKVIKEVKDTVLVTTPEQAQLKVLDEQMREIETTNQATMAEIMTLEGRVTEIQEEIALYYQQIHDREEKGKKLLEAYEQLTDAIAEATQESEEVRLAEERALQAQKELEEARAKSGGSAQDKLAELRATLREINS